MRFDPASAVSGSQNLGFPAFSRSASGRGCVKTQNRPLEIVSKLGEFSVEVSCLLTGRFRLISQSIASHVVFEGDFWCEPVAEFSHNLGHKRPLALAKKGNYYSLRLIEVTKIAVPLTVLVICHPG